MVRKIGYKIDVATQDDTKLSLTYEYDGESKLTFVKDSTGNEVVSYDYDTDGNLSERRVAGADLTTSYAYDYQKRLTKLTNQTESAGVISKYQPEYLTNGRKSKEVSEVLGEDGKNGVKTATYTYDLLGRITKETKTGSEDVSYTYDSHNNRKKMTVGNKTTVYKYNQNDELLRTDTLNGETEENAVVIYKNDKNGNQLATINRYEIPNDRKDGSYVDIDVTLGDNQLNDNVVNHYNALNQLTKTLTKNYKVSFTYDAEGLRASKTVNGEKTVYVWDGDQVVMELSKGGAVQKRYIRGNDLVYADKGENTEKTYYVTDMHGNVVQLLDESGNVTKTYEYDSFGNEVKPEKKDENPYRYCGEYYDKETEEVYLRARYYEPGVGRFITRDTYTGESDEPLSLHLYTYCENDGVNNIDPNGYCPVIANIKWNIKEKDITKLFPIRMIWNYKCGKQKKKNPKKISSNGLKFIKTEEGFYDKPYTGLDSANRTIGYGHVIRKGEDLSFLSEGDASTLLEEDIVGKKNKKGKMVKSSYRKELNKVLNKKLKIHVRQNQYDALTALVYNAGAYIWGKSPNFKKLLKDGNLDQPMKKKKVVNEFATYVHYTDAKGVKHKARGLWRRHVNEGILFTENDYSYKSFGELRKLGWKCPIKK